MSDDEISADTNKILAAFDFATATTEQEKRRRQQTGELFLSILPVLDSIEALERHCQELVEAGNRDVPSRSVSLIVKQFRAALAQVGVTPMEASGQAVDLELHEVVATRSAPDAEDTVLEETSSGYFWDGKPLRLAKVVVARPADSETHEESRGRKSE